MAINRVNITGNLTRDPELRATQAGTAILAFGVAVNDRRKNGQTGEWEDYPNFVDCKLFGNRASAVAQYLAKGAKVAIEGKLSYSAWEAQDGTKRSKLEVIVDELEFMASRNNGGQQGAAQPAAAPMQPMPRQAPAAPQYAPQAAAPAPVQQPMQPAAPYQPQPMQAPAAPVQQAMPMQVPAAAPAVASIYDEDVPF